MSGLRRLETPGPGALLLLLLATLRPSTGTLIPRSAASKPISISPSQNWDGDDGPWSSFTIQLGTPAQNVRVYVSTSLDETWVVNDKGCVTSQTACNEDRGRTFSPSSSTTWNPVGNGVYAVNSALSSQFSGTLGHENYTLGLQGSGGPSLPAQAVVAYANTTQDLNLGMFGANPLASNDPRNPRNFITSLKNQSRIPSASFGYTAGNQYRLKKVYGSLTLGGYDASLITPNSLSFSFKGDNPARYLQVSIQSITSKDQGGKTAALLPSPITASVDSTASMIWLPLEACKAFETTFSLVWDQKTELYLVSDDLHSSLTQQNASVSFEISNGNAGEKGAQITLPYASFDLFVKPPYPGINSSQRYFPLKRAANESQYTLGRTLLQEAYLTVDWDRRNFSLQQCNYTTDLATSKFVPIYAPGEEPPTPIPTATKAGVGVGVAVGLVLVIGLTAWLLWRRRRERRRLAAELAKSGINPKEGLIRQGQAKGEMGAGIENAVYEMEGSDGNALKPYGGETPPWVNEKAHYPGLGFGPDSVAEIDGEARRAELSGAVGFYGGRGVHEMYDASTLRPAELPSTKSEAPTPFLRGAGSSEDLSKPTPRGSSNGSKPSSTPSSFFSMFSRKSRPVSSADRKSSLVISGPSTQPSPVQAETATGTRGQTQLVSVPPFRRRMDAAQPSSPEDEPPPVPPRDSKPPPRSHIRSMNTLSSTSTKYQDHDFESHRGSGLSSMVRDYGEDRSRVSQARSRISDGQRSSRPSLPSPPDSAHILDQRRVRGSSHVSAASSGTRHGDDTFSPLSRTGTTNILSPVSPSNENPSRYGLDQYGRF